MTRVTWRGCVWTKINRRDWEFEGGDANADLLKLPDRKQPGRHLYFRLRGPVAQ